MSKAADPSRLLRSSKDAPSVDETQPPVLGTSQWNGDGEARDRCKQTNFFGVCRCHFHHLHLICPS